MLGGGHMDQYILKGRLVKGIGKAGYFTQLDWVVAQCKEKLGFSPYPGTVNIKVEGENLKLWRSLQEKEAIEIQPPEGSNFCTGKTLKASIGDIPAAIMLPGVADYPEDIVEIIAPVMVKEALKIEDGNEIEVKIRA